MWRGQCRCGCREGKRGVLGLFDWSIQTLDEMTLEGQKITKIKSFSATKIHIHKKATASAISRVLNERENKN